MAEKKIWVAFKSATPVPASVLGETADRRMKIGAPVQLPATYAAQMIDNGFAVVSSAPVTTEKTSAKTTSKKATAKAAAGKAAAANVTDKKATADAVTDPAQASLNMGDTGEGTTDPLTVEAAQAAYDAITAQMETLSEDTPEWQALKDQLDDAATALAEAQDAAKAGV
ncbi:hypothetical protein KM176_05585 [Pseudooceanicola sp. CBS1P-1]|uniref:Uncharacterized protein n=1 Tax=Pseudooceanicola albus TaxID=2692189 RepID=A0A6L7G1A8_9RHOB|nr:MULTISPECIES: hypothetical protein [Pseudooceanicola]MBT9383324.1 hypothetical protein [Pseudooceanicola endophyticus]MXN16353.1 hypothetical protein [Pseudooceanicola albus]